MLEKNVLKAFQESFRPFHLALLDESPTRVLPTAGVAQGLLHPLISPFLKAGLGICPTDVGVPSPTSRKQQGS